MRNQLPPPLNDTESFDSITNAKQGARKTRLSNIKSKVNSAYTAYIANKSYLGVMVPIALGSVQKKDMEHCYNSKTEGLSSLKSTIIGSRSAEDRKLCPYCGFREPSEFDHYLPKSKFQEFSIFSKNLIWTCHQCNHKKKESFIATKRYLNSYYDVVPEEQFLFCTIDVPLEKQGISFYFEKPNSITDRQYADIISHAKNLDLLQTYEHMASQILPIWFKRWEILAGQFDQEKLKTYLFHDMEAGIVVDTDKYGKNHYKRVLKVSVKKHLSEIVENFYT